MNPTPEQLRLAADIIEKGLEWEWKSHTYKPETWFGGKEVSTSPFRSLIEGNEIRLKPWSLPPPPKGRQWHRNDWTQGMLPDGYRPMLLGEQETENGFAQGRPHDVWIPATWKGKGGVPADTFHHRTRRPLPVEPEYIPLGPEDVPPGSVFRAPEWESWIYISPSLVAKEAVTWVRSDWAKQPWPERLTFMQLMGGDWRISRDQGKTWFPCKKLNETQP